MIITFHGVRGSTPCQSDSVARYGGNTSCVSVESPGESHLLFDLGTGLRYFGESKMAAGEVFEGTVLLSHLHWDHVQGLPFFRPLLHPDAQMTVYAPEQEDDRHPRDILLTTIRPPLFPIGLHEMPGGVRVRRAKPHVSVGGYEIRSIPVPHNGAACGYRVEHGGQSVAFISDHQQPADPDHVDDAISDLCRDVDLLIHDAQYTDDEFAQRKSWGHSTAAYAVRVAATSGARRLALFHHDPFHDDDTIDLLASAARRLGDPLGVEVFAAAEGTSVDLAERVSDSANPPASPRSPQSWVDPPLGSSRQP